MSSSSLLRSRPRSLGAPSLGHEFAGAVRSRIFHQRSAGTWTCRMCYSVFLSLLRRWRVGHVRDLCRYVGMMDASMSMTSSLSALFLVSSAMAFLKPSSKRLSTTAWASIYLSLHNQGLSTTLHRVNATERPCGFSASSRHLVGTKMMLLHVYRPIAVCSRTAMTCLAQHLEVDCRPTHPDDSKIRVH